LISNNPDKDPDKDPDKEIDHRRTTRTLVSLLFVPAGLGLALYTLQTVWLGIAGLLFPYPLDYGEGAMLELSRRLAAGLPIYKQPSGEPYFFANYTPLLPALISLPVRWLGTVFWPGRAVVVFSTLAIAALIGREVWAAAGKRQGWPALLAGLAFLATPYVYHWIAIYRVDLPALLLSLAGVAVGVAGWRDRRLYLAALLFAGSIYTKQNYVLAPVALGLWLLLQDWRRAIRLAITLGLIGGLPFLALQWVTNGAFLFDLLIANLIPFSLSQLRAALADFGRTHAGLLLLAAGGFLAGSDWQRHRYTGNFCTSVSLWLSPWHLYLMLAILSLFLAGKAGAWENYFLEALALVVLFVGRGLAAVPVGSRRSLLAALLLLAQLPLLWHDPAPALRLFRETQAVCEALLPRLRQEQGPILAEEMGLLVLSGHPVLYFSFEYAQLAAAGLWDQSWELEGLSRGEFSLVILNRGTRESPERYGRFSRAFLSALDRRYDRVERIGVYDLYRPTPPLDPRQDRFDSGLRLAGSRLEGGQAGEWGHAVLPGGTLIVTLLWEAAGPPPPHDKVFVHLLDPAGNKVAQHDGEPFDGIYPTGRWAEGEAVRDVHRLHLPASLPPGRYRVWVGLYDRETEERRESDGRDAVLIGEIIVKADGM